MNIQMLEYAASYDAQLVTGVAGRVPHMFQWKRAHAEPDALVLETPSKSLLVEVIPPDGEPWVGSFLQGLGGVTGLYATPSSTTLCVVANGQGYWVPVLAPTDFSEVKCNPIKTVFVVPQQNVMVFASYTELAGYGPMGLMWVTERLSWDGLKITEVTDKQIHGLAWDSPANKEVPFVVDVESGKHQGGSSPECYAATK